MNLRKIIETQSEIKDFSFKAIVDLPVIRKARNNSIFLTLNLINKDLKVETKIWNFNEQDQPIFEQGNLIEVTGNFNKYNNKLQFIVEKADLLNDNMLRTELLPNPPYPMEKLIKEFKTFVHEIIDSDYEKIIKAIFDPKRLEKFCDVRAGLSIHHNVVGGLLWHTLTLLKMAKGVLPAFSYLPINKSLLYAGIILHDIGKIIEIGDFFEKRYSKQGKLLGHIVIGANLVTEINLEKNLQIPSEKIHLLQHLILASHGKLENGSPVNPIIPEALLLSQLDNMDAKLNQVYLKTKNLPLDSYSEKILLDNGKYTEFLIHKTEIESEEK